MATATVAAAAVCALVGSSAACIGGGCSAKASGVEVYFLAGTPPEAVATFTASGACGPAPPPICQIPNPNNSPCEAAVPSFWSLHVPADASGACVIHVVLKDGQVFDDTVTVKCASGSCGDQCLVDGPVTVRFTSGDGGSAD